MNLQDIYQQVWEEKIEEEEIVSQDWKRIIRKFFLNKKTKYILDRHTASFAKLRLD